VSCYRKSIAGSSGCSDSRAVAWSAVARSSHLESRVVRGDIGHCVAGEPVDLQLESCEVHGRLAHEQRRRWPVPECGDVLASCVPSSSRTIRLLRDRGFSAGVCRSDMRCSYDLYTLASSTIKNSALSDIRFDMLWSDGEVFETDGTDVESGSSQGPLRYGSMRCRHGI
jgi:hypothetical protein